MTDRQVQGELGASGITVNGNETVMVLNGIPDHGQAESGPASSHHLGGIERIKDMFQVML